MLRRSGSTPTKAQVAMAALQKSMSGDPETWFTTLPTTINRTASHVAPLTVSQRDINGKITLSTNGARAIGIRSITPIPTVSRRYQAIDPKRKRMLWAPIVKTRAPHRILRLRLVSTASNTAQTVHGRSRRTEPGVRTSPPDRRLGEGTAGERSEPGVGCSGKRVRKARNDPLVSVGGPSYVPTTGSNTRSTGAMTLEGIACLDRAAVSPTGAARAMTDWVAVKGEGSPGAARDLVQTARRTEYRPELREVLLDGEASFDRVVAASRITADTTELLLRHLDVSGVRREAARCRLITEHEEQRTFVDRFLVLQPDRK